MNYKIPIDEKRYKKLLENEGQSSTDQKQIEEDNEDQGEGEPKVDKASKNQLDFYINQLDSYRGKNIDQIVREKFQPEKQVIDQTTDDELYQMAKAYSDSYRAHEKSELEKRAGESKDNLTEKAKKIQLLADEDQSKIEKNYEKSTRDEKNDAIKNGIARSSIIENLLKDYQSAKNEQISQTQEKAQSEIEVINEKIKGVEGDLALALENLDMQTAVKLNEQLTSLKSARDKANLEANKHNAIVEERIQKYKKELLESDEGKAIVEYIERGEGELVTKVKIALTKYIDSLPIDDALEELDDQRYLAILGEESIEELKKYLEEKRSRQ